MESLLLSFEIGNAGRQIQIACDEQGMAVLIQALEKIRAVGGDVDLLSPSNGGRELMDQTLWGQEAVGKVVIIRAGEWPA